MVILEIIMIVIGLGAVVMSYRITDQKKDNIQNIPKEEKILQDSPAEIEQAREEMEHYKEDVITSAEEELSRLSNDKLMGMNEYSEEVLNRMAKNHEEVVFLYDMLNEKAKEVKNTVKDVNIAKHEVKKMQNDIAAEPVSSVQQAVPSQQEQTDNAAYTATVRDVAKERLSELVKQSNEKARISEEQGKSKNQAGKLKSIVSGEPEIDEIPENPQDGSPESIVYLYRKGMTVRDIAKQLGIGVGEVSLIIGLHEKEKQSAE